MKKLFFIFICLFGVGVVIWRGTYSTDMNSFTRKNLQDFVVSTSLSYYYNNQYSDYEQYAMDQDMGDDDYTSFYWRNVSNSPEMVNRYNEYNIDCSSFVLMTYLYSIGYDMKEYYSNSEYYKYFNDNMMFDNFTWIGSKSSYEQYKRSYLKFGKSFSTGFVVFADVVSGHNGLVGDEYVNNDYSNNSSIVYHYNVNLGDDYSYNESSSKIESVKNNIISILEPGDALVYRRKNKSTGDENGHIALYIGDTISNGDMGFLHATGVDYNSSSNSIIIGDDDYAIRYDTWDGLFEKHIFIDSDTVASSEFAIIRPINTYCDGSNDSCSVDIDSNVIVRNELSKLGIEQYQNTFDRDGSIVVGEYNSINKGDNINYNLLLTNKSSFYYCSSGGYLTKEKCESFNREWILTNQSGIEYNDLKIVGKIPDGTNYVSCTNNCIYDDENRVVVWDNISIGIGVQKRFTYVVKVDTNDNIENFGMEITTSNGNTLIMGDLITKINPTINKDVNMGVINENVDKFKKLVIDGKIVYNSSSSGSDYKKNLDNIESAEISKLGFIKSIYYNSFGMDLDFLTASNIRSAIFNSELDAGVDSKFGIFGKKNDTLIDSLISDGKYSSNYQKIDKMLVKGMYGGRLLKGDDNGDRARFLKTSYLEFGDIVITYSNNVSTIDVYLFLGFDEGGNAILVEYDKNSDGIGEIFIYDVNKTTGKSGYRIFKEIYAKDLFVVLRPTQLYGTTINYNYNGGSGDINNYIAYNTYNNLVEPIRDGYKFDGWYSDSGLIHKVSNDSKLLDDDSYTLYAKWNLVSDFEFDSNLDVDEDRKYINLFDSTEVFKLIDSVSVNNGNIIISDIDGNEKNDDDVLKTGDLFMFYIDDNLIAKYEISILGDVNGDGDVSVVDVSKLFQYYRGIIDIKDIYVNASDVVNDGSVRLNDVAKLFQYVRNKISSLR